MTQAEKAKILVVEDHGVVAEAMLRLLKRQKDLTGCGKVSEMAAIIPAVKANGPDLVLLDILLGDENAIGLIPSLVAKFSGMRLLVYSQIDDFSQIEAAIKSGAHGYINKQETTEEILTAIRTVLSGEIYLSRKMAARLLHNFVHPPLQRSTSESPLKVSLTRRESQVLQLIGSGRKNTEIAAEMTLSVKTVETHRENIKRKLGIHSAPELVHHAIKWVESRVPESLFLQKPPISPSSSSML